MVDGSSEHSGGCKCLIGLPDVMPPEDPNPFCAEVLSIEQMGPLSPRVCSRDPYEPDQSGRVSSLFFTLEKKGDHLLG